jgi:hypothetical protein
MPFAQVQAPEKIKTIDDVKSAMHELSWLDHERERRDALCQQEIDALRKRQADRYIIEVDGCLMPLTERRALVNEKVEAWAEKDLPALLPEDKKSLELAHGTLGYRQQPLRVTFAEGMDEQKVLDKIDKKTSFREYLVGLFDRLLSKTALSVLITIAPKLSMSSITKAYKESRIDKPTLKQIGLIVIEARDELYIKPARYQDDSLAN